MTGDGGTVGVPPYYNQSLLAGDKVRGRGGFCKLIYLEFNLLLSYLVFGFGK